MHVERACLLLWISLGLSTFDSLLTVLANLGSYYPGQYVVRAVLKLMLGLAIVLWFTRMLSTRRNWMRLLISMLFGAGCAIFVYFFSTDSTMIALEFAIRPIHASIMLAQLALAATVVVLINTAPSRAWFAAHRQRRAPGP